MRCFSRDPHWRTGTVSVWRRLRMRRIPVVACKRGMSYEGYLIAIYMDIFDSSDTLLIFLLVHGPIAHGLIT